MKLSNLVNACGDARVKQLPIQQICLIFRLRDLPFISPSVHGSATCAHPTASSGRFRWLVWMLLSLKLHGIVNRVRIRCGFHFQAVVNVRHASVVPQLSQALSNLFPRSCRREDSWIAVEMRCSCSYQMNPG